jgi:hypothetical protein
MIIMIKKQSNRRMRIDSRPGLCGLLLVGLCAITMGMIVPASAQEASNAAAEVFTPVTGTATDLIYGRFSLVNQAVGGTIVLNPVTNTRVVDASKILLLGGLPNAQRSSFIVDGPAGAGLSITLPSAPVPLSLTGAPDMFLTTFVRTGVASPVFDGTGAYNFDVGATLTVNPFQPGGTYEGTFDVTVTSP